MLSELRSACLAVLVLTAITGIAYPLAITAVAQLALPHQAQGSLQTDRAGHVVGSSLVGQAFTDPRYLWGRPSATSDGAYNAMASSADNLGPTNPDLATAVADRIAALRAADPTATGPVPIDLVTSSASGLDPDISPDAAAFQVHRIAVARRLSDDDVRAVIARHTTAPLLGIFGEPHVNVLAVNLELEAGAAIAAGPR